MQMFHRKNGEEQPYWPAGPFKIRLPIALSLTLLLTGVIKPWQRNDVCPWEALVPPFFCV
ncbi:MAG: hypothetical protein V7760_08805 [Marinobacter sp.]